jgi:hypothetical protein
MRKHLLAALTTVTILGLVSCRREEATVEVGRVFLYATADDCHGSARAGPDDVGGRGPRGVIAEIEPGSVLEIRDNDIGKEFLCYEVKYRGMRGYVLASERFMPRGPEPRRKW